MNYNIKNIFKVGSIISMILITISVLIIGNNPATGFESSIYKSTTLIFWISIFSSFLLGIFITFYSIRNQLDKPYMLLGLVLTVFCSLLVLSLAIIKGYFLWNLAGDPAAHFKYIDFIIENGFFDTTDFYPVLHIYSSEFLMILKISPEKTSWILPLIFETLNLLFIYVLANSILNDSKKSLLVTILSSTLSLGWYITFTPNHLANLFFPLVLMILVKCLLTKKDRVLWTILLIIMILLLPPFHPVAGVTLLLITISLLIFTFINKYIDIKAAINISTTLILLVAVWTINWISSFFIWERTINNINTLISEGGPTSISKLSDQAIYATNLGYNIFEYGLKIYGGALFFIVLTILAFPIIWKVRKDEKMKNLLMLYSPVIIIGITIIVSYGVNLFGPTRFLVYVTYLTLIISGFFIYKVIEDTKRYKKIILPSLAILILIIFINGTFTVYPSDYTLTTSRETTKSEVMGFDWFLNNLNYKTDISGLTINPAKMSSYYGIGKKIKREVKDVPYHFGYQNSTSISESYAKNTYLILTERDRQFYVKVLPELAKDRWTQSDFDNLNNDRNLDKLYSNGEFEAWFINKD